MSNSSTSSPDRSRACRSGIAFVLAVLAAIGLAGNASADFGSHQLPCIQDAAAAAGHPSLNCTANDLGVSSITVTNPADSGACKSDPTGNWNIEGYINVAADSNDRYDLGFYISQDGVQALTGTCWVDVIEDNEPGDTFFDSDGDACGDHPKGEALQMLVHNLSVKCTDSDNDGYLDVAMCASYDNNTTGVCNDETDAVPSTDAKCQCLVTNTDVPVPQCANNAECTADDNPCTTATCVGLGQPGADLIGCA